jgi:hypothetical protein
VPLALGLPAALGCRHRPAAAMIRLAINGPEADAATVPNGQQRSPTHRPDQAKPGEPPMINTFRTDGATRRVVRRPHARLPDTAGDRVVTLARDGPERAFLLARSAACG